MPNKTINPTANRRFFWAGASAILAQNQRQLSAGYGSVNVRFGSRADYFKKRTTGIYALIFAFSSKETKFPSSHEQEPKAPF